MVKYKGVTWSSLAKCTVYRMTLLACAHDIPRDRSSQVEQGVETTNMEALLWRKLSCRIATASHCGTVSSRCGRHGNPGLVTVLIIVAMQDLSLPYIDDQSYCTQE